MFIRILSVLLGFLGLVGTASYFIGFIVSPVALYKGFIKKDWKMGKIILIMIVGGFVLQFITLIIYGAIKSV